MTYLLEELLTIRKYRDRIALGHTLTAKKELDDAKTKQAESISELMSFTKWRQKKEKKLFEQLMHQTIKICDLELFYQYIEFLIDKQISLVDNIKKREQEVLNAEEKLKKAQEHYVKLNQAKQKLEEHKNICSQEKYLQNERREDNEQDEFNTNVKVHIWP